METKTNSDNESDDRRNTNSNYLQI